MTRGHIEDKIKWLESVGIKFPPDYPESNPTCAWTQDPDWDMSDTWSSGCGELWSFTAGGPKENNINYCHYCGKPVVIEGGQE